MVISRNILAVLVIFGIMFATVEYAKCAELEASSDTENVGVDAGETAAGKLKETEPNNIFGMSNSVPADGEISATIAPVRDVDWYRLEVGRQGQLNIKIL